MAYKDQKMVNTYEIWGGDPGANAGRDTKADEMVLDLCDGSFLGHMHSRVCSPVHPGIQ